MVIKNCHNVKCIGKQHLIHFSKLCQILYLEMSSDVFYETCIQFGNTKLDDTDKFCKLRPTEKDLNNKFLKHSFNGENKLIDKLMISYFGRYGTSRRINNLCWFISFRFLLKRTVMSFNLIHIQVLRLVSKLHLKQDGAWKRKLC